jgi:hypothetical protein
MCISSESRTERRPASDSGSLYTTIDTTSYSRAGAEKTIGGME